MNLAVSRAVIGIGSFQGQDAIGWHVVELLSNAGLPEIQWIVARSPSEILDRVEGVRELHLIDACIGPEPGRLHRLTWPDPRIVDLRWTNSHGTDIYGNLRLLSELGMLPTSVAIWAIECDGDTNSGSWSETLQQAIESAANSIARELRRIPSSRQIYS